MREAGRVKSRHSQKKKQIKGTRETGGVKVKRRYENDRIEDMKT